MSFTNADSSTCLVSHCVEMWKLYSVYSLCQYESTNTDTHLRGDVELVLEDEPLRRRRILFLVYHQMPKLADYITAAHHH